VAQTKKKRQRKKRGTQAGNVDTKRRARPKNRAEARSQAKSGSRNRNRTSTPRVDNPPTWRSAIMRGVVASLVFLVLLMLLFGRGLNEALPIALFMLVFYIPAGYYMDSVLWRRRERARIRARGKQN
jgi:hypothetical protein